MQFYSDNCGPVHPKVMEAILRANDGYVSSYGADELTQKAEAGLRDLFETPEATVQLVGTGSAANSLNLSTLCQPWHVVYCGALSHIRDDECNAVEFFGGGLKLSPLPTPDGKITPEDLEDAILAQGAGDVHRPQPGALSITQLTECGTVYSLEEIRALCTVAKRHKMRTHLDGARCANAIAALGCSPAEMSWKAGIDAISFGGTKNGLMGVEACIIFDPSVAWELALRRKRAAQLFSKQRYLAAQINAVLDGDLWLDLARQANTSGKMLSDGLRTIPGLSFDYAPGANIIFARLPNPVHDNLAKHGLLPARQGSGQQIRLVCDWAVTEADVQRFIDIAQSSTSQSQSLVR